MQLTLNDSDLYVRHKKSHFRFIIPKQKNLFLWYWKSSASIPMSTIWGVYDFINNFLFSYICVTDVQKSVTDVHDGRTPIFQPHTLGKVLPNKVMNVKKRQNNDKKHCVNSNYNSLTIFMPWNFYFICLIDIKSTNVKDHQWLIDNIKKIFLQCII